MENNIENPKKSFNIYKLITIILVILIAWFIFNKYVLKEKVEAFSVERETAAELGILPNMTRAEVEDRLNREVDESMFNVSINPTPSFPNGKSAGNLRIENIPGNNYSFVVEIVRNDTNETVLKTGLIYPGYYIEEAPLDVELPKGVYACVANFIAYNTETLAEIGRAGTQILVSIRE